MTSIAKLKLLLFLLILILAGVILALLTSRRELIKPFPRKADVKIIFSTPPPLPTAPPETPSPTPTAILPTSPPAPTATSAPPSPSPLPSATPTKVASPSAT